MIKRIKQNNNIRVINLKKLNNFKGKIIKIIKSTDKFFNTFGELYISELKPNQIKAWRYHKQSTQNIFLVSGKCKLVYLNRKKFKKIILSDKLPKLIIIPKKTWYGYQNLSKNISIILNLSSKKYLESEILRKAKIEMNYKW